MYTPNNSDIFLAAFSGAIAGMAVSDRALTDPSPAAYTDVVANAGAFAQSFDSLVLPAATIPDVLLDQVEALAQSAWQDRSPSASPESLDPASYTVGCQALLALIAAEFSYLAANVAPIPPQALAGQVLVDAADTTPDFLAAKLANGGGLNFRVLGPGNERLQLTGAKTSFINLAAPVDVIGNGVPQFLNTGFTHTNLTDDPFAGTPFVKISWSVSFRRVIGGPIGELSVNPTVDGAPVPTAQTVTEYEAGAAGQAVQLSGFFILPTDNAPHVYSLEGTNTPSVLNPVDAMRVQIQSVAVGDIFI